jgi:acetoin utilization deacetylase AcuC-like enzyme
MQCRSTSDASDCKPTQADQVLPPRQADSASLQDPVRLSNHVRYGSLAASRLGLDPRINPHHAPVVYHENYSFDNWPENHSFPMNKFAATAKALLSADESGTPLVRDPLHFFRPLSVDQIPVDWFSIIDSTFLQQFLTGQLSVTACRRIGFREQTSRRPLIERALLEVAGTVLTCHLALKYGLASHVAGGTHHATPTHGAGYTILNDLAVATHVISINPVRRVLVVDCDVHQGDGTAVFGSTVLQEKLFTLSLHCQSNYPSIKERSTYDVGLPDGMQDDEYLEILQDSVERAIETVQPDLVLYDAGVDVYRHDTLGRLCLSENGIHRRDRLVIERCIAAQIPVAAVVGGGYDPDVEKLGRRHAIVHQECAHVWRKFRLWERASGVA